MSDRIDVIVFANKSVPMICMVPFGCVNSIVPVQIDFLSKGLSDNSARALNSAGMTFQNARHLSPVWSLANFFFSRSWMMSSVPSVVPNPRLLELRDVLERNLKHVSLGG